MKKLLFLIIIGLAGWYLYHHAGIFNTAQTPPAPPQAGATASSPAPSAPTSPVAPPAPAASVSGVKELAGCGLVDESGGAFDFGAFLGRNRDKVVMLCVDIANRPPCAAGGDDNMRAHYRLIDELQARYPDRVQVVGYNFSGSLEDVRRYKSYYGFNYPMLSFPPNPTASSEAEARQMKAFIESFNGITCPSVMFVKDGRYIVRTVSDVRDDPALEGMLRDLL